MTRSIEEPSNVSYRENYAHDPYAIRRCALKSTRKCRAVEMLMRDNFLTPFDEEMRSVNFKFSRIKNGESVNVRTLKSRETQKKERFYDGNK